MLRVFIDNNTISINLKTRSTADRYSKKEEVKPRRSRYMKLDSVLTECYNLTSFSIWLNKLRHYRIELPGTEAIGKKVRNGPQHGFMIGMLIV